MFRFFFTVWLNYERFLSCLKQMRIFLVILLFSPSRCPPIMTFKVFSRFEKASGSHRRSRNDCRAGVWYKRCFFIRAAKPVLVSASLPWRPADSVIPPGGVTPVVCCLQVKELSYGPLAGWGKLRACPWPLVTSSWIVTSPTTAGYVSNCCFMAI